MATSAFSGKLNSNEIFAALYNMIISQQVFADNIKGVNADLVSKFRVDGSMYGDSKLYYSTDAIGTQEWLGDNEAQNLLKIHRPADPECQVVTIDQYRMIPLTVDNYLTKRAWGDEGAFSQFQSVMLGWMRETKRIYDNTLIDSFVGTTVSKANRAEISIPVSTAVSGLSGQEKARVEAQTIANSLANLVVDLKDISRDFNDYKHLRSYEESDFYYIWNADYVNKITNIDLPTVFHKDGLFNSFDNVLPKRFFGDVVTSAVTKANNDGTYRSLIEADYATAGGAEYTHVFPGDLIPAGTCKVLAYNEGTANTKYRTAPVKATARTVSSGIAANECYKANDKIICKIIHKSAIPFMSAFETSTSFFNPRSLTENHYIIWGYSTPVYLYDKPFLTVKEA